MTPTVNQTHPPQGCALARHKGHWAEPRVPCCCSLICPSKKWSSAARDLGATRCRAGRPAALGTRGRAHSSVGSHPHLSAPLTLFDTISQHMGTCSSRTGTKGGKAKGLTLGKPTQANRKFLVPDSARTPQIPGRAQPELGGRWKALPAAARSPRARPVTLRLRRPPAPRTLARSSTESSVYRVWFRQAIHFVLRSSSQSRWVA